MLRFTTSAGADNTEAEIRAQVASAKLTINGQDVVNASLANIFNAYEIVGQANVQNPTGISGAVELVIGNKLFTDPAVRELFGIGTANVSSITVTVTAGTLTTVANCQVYTARIPVNQNMGAHVRLIDYPVPFNSTGQSTYDNLPRDPSFSYLFVNATNGAGVISSGECKVNSVQILEPSPPSVNNLFCGNDRMSQITGNFLYHFGNGSVDTRLPMTGVNDLRFITSFSTAPGASGYILSSCFIKDFPDLSAA